MNRIAYISVFLCLLLFPAKNHGQTREKIDSLFTLVKTAEDTERVDLFLEISELYWRQSFDTSMLMATHANTLARKLGDSLRIASSLNMIGNASYLMADFPNSLDHYHQSLSMRLEIGDNNEIAKSYNNIGAVLLKMKELNQALDYFKLALDIYKQLDNDEVVFSLINNIGAVYLEKEEMDTAYQYFQEALEIANSIPSRNDAAIALSNLGEITMKMGLLKQSEEYLLKGLEISMKLDNHNMLATIYSNLGSLKMKKKEYNLVPLYLEKGLAISREINALAQLQEIYLHLSDYYDIKSNPSQALKYYKLYASTRDSTFSEEKKLKIAEMQLMFNTEIMKQEIEILTKDKEINTLRQARQKIMIFTLAAVILMIVIVLFIMIQQRNLKRNTNLLLTEKNRELKYANTRLKESEKHLQELNATKDKFFSIIGHDLRNPLNALLGFSELISGNSHDYSLDVIQKYSKIINEAAKNIHLLIENLLEWSRSQSGNLEFNPRNNKLKKITDNIVKVLEIQASEKGISIKPEISKSATVYADENLLATILRNLVNNSIKFTNSGGEISIYSREDKDGIRITVQDTGIGMAKELVSELFKLNSNAQHLGTSDEKGTGLGLILCKEFVEMHGGSIQVESEPSRGSSFSFNLPFEK